MGGGLMQLVAYGAQDIYLTGNPQITFFKVVYRRHTNFSMECIQQTVSGTSTLGASATNGTVTVSRNGDLLGKVYVRSSTPGIRNGCSLVNQVEVEIGGQQIDKYESNWEYMWNDLVTPDSKASALKAMQGMMGGASIANGSTGPCAVQVPLLFWWCNNPGLYLPLIALQYHEVKLKFTWGVGTATVGADASCQVWADYVYLDTDERRRFAQVSHEYLIEQHQYQTEGRAVASFKLNFNHPVKELIWLTQSTGNNTFRSNTQTSKLTLNGHDRFAAQTPEYFQLRQPYDHHTAVPVNNLDSTSYAAVKSGGTSFTRALPGGGLAAQALDLAANPGAQNAAIDAGSCQVLLAEADAVNATYDAHGNGATSNPVRDTFVVLTTDLAVTLAVGDVVLVTVSGTESAANTILTTVSAINAGAAGGVHANNTALRFSNSILGTVAGGDGVASNFTLESITRVASAGGRTSNHTAHINVYSFALKPEEHQPSGTCNFSRIDTAHLVHTGTNPNISIIYAINYNVLRIMSGMGGLAYSN